jgi:hypothetical protein
MREKKKEKVKMGKSILSFYEFEYTTKIFIQLFKNEFIVK